MFRDGGQPSACCPSSCCTGVPLAGQNVPQKPGGAKQPSTYPHCMQHCFCSWLAQPGSPERGCSCGGKRKALLCTVSTPREPWPAGLTSLEAPARRDTYLFSGSRLLSVSAPLRFLSALLTLTLSGGICVPLDLWGDFLLLMLWRNQAFPFSVSPSAAGKSAQRKATEQQVQKRSAGEARLPRAHSHQDTTASSFHTRWQPRPTVPGGGSAGQTVAPSPDVTKAWACTASAHASDLTIGARGQQGWEVGDPAGFMVRPPLTALGPS